MYNKRMETAQQQEQSSQKELAEIAGRVDLDIRMVTALSGDRTLNAREINILERLRTERGEGIYSDILYAVTHRTFPSRQAHMLWKEIKEHRQTLKRELGRDVGISVTIHDFLTNISSIMNNVSIIEESKLASFANVASQDSLTGLYDNATFKHRLHEEMDRQQRYGGPLSLVMFDIDHFKKVNDNLGHAEGDIVLKRIAETLLDQVRSMDTPARYGGEEFAVILPEVEIGAAFIFAERLRQNIETEFKNFAMPVTISAGIANLAANNEETTEDLIRKADAKLYEAKEAGRNQVKK